jgi:hypothetical protein
MNWQAKLAGAFVALTGLLLSTPDAAHAAPGFNWRVENPFRFFTDPHDTEVHRATYEALTPEEKSTPVLSSERKLEMRYSDGWAAAMYRQTCWNDAKHRFECPDKTDYINPTSHRIVVEVRDIEDAQNISCTWLSAPFGGSNPRGDAVTQPCSIPATFEVPYPYGAKITLEIGGLVIAEEKVQVTDILIAAMGDSFASGEGNPDVPVRFSRERAADYVKGKGSDLAGYPARIGSWRTIGDKQFIKENARWLDQACHRSLYSQQMRAALQLAVENPHRAVTFVGVACSGAEVTAGLFLRYKGNEWVPNPPDLSQISAVAQAQCGKHDAPMQDLPEAYHINGKIPVLQGGLVLRKCAPEQSRKIDLVFLSIGGNDIGFARLLANAVLADKSLLRKLGGWLGEVYGMSEAMVGLKNLDARYKAMNRAIHNILHVPWDESDRVILTAYPGLALLGDGSEVCPDGRAGMEVLPDFKLSAEKVREGTWIADKLQHVMMDNAEKNGWTFVDSHRAKFIGRGICAGFTDNAFSVADDLRLPRKIDGVWQPYNPADYRAYVPRQRWFRTPNDAYMTGNFHVAVSLLQKVLKLEAFSWFQVLLAATYSGAFHPTAEGHAAIADAVADKARLVLDKYERASTSSIAGR